MNWLRLNVAVGLALAMALPAVASAQAPSEPNRIPLSSYQFYPASSKDGIYERQVAEGTLRIGFSDLVPTWGYDISWYKSSLLPPSFPLPSELKSAPGFASLNRTQRADPCATLTGRARDVWEAATESEVAQRVGVLLHELATSACTNQSVKTTAQATIASTRSKEVIEVKIEAGTILEVTVLRRGERAKFIIKGPPPPRFFQTYGLSYLKDRDEEFFTEETTGGKHIIRAKTRRSDWEPAGLLLLNYRIGGPWEKAADLAINLAGALSFNEEDPSIGLGLNFTFANNLGIVAGVAMTEESRLRGEYQPGPDGTLLDQALTSDQLVDDDPDPTLFVGLSLNLSSNPFKKKQPETTTQAAKDGSK